MISVQLFYMVSALVPLELSMESHTGVEAVWRDLIHDAGFSISQGSTEKYNWENKWMCVCVIY